MCFLVSIFLPKIILLIRLQVLIQIALLIWVSLLQSVQDGCTPILGWLCLAPAVAVLILEWLCSFFGALGIACLICSPTVPCSSLTVTSLVQDLGVHLRKSAMHPPSMFAKPCLANLKTKLTATSRRYWISIGVHAIHVIATRNSDD